MNDKQIELDIWKGDWGLASVDFNCLQTMALMKFLNADVKINKTNNPFRSPTGHLPAFKCQEITTTNYQDIVSYLKNQNWNIDDLSPKELSEIVAYDIMLKDKLYPALLHTCWINNKNYVTVTRPWYAKALPFPLNYFYPGHYRRKYTNFVQSLYPNLKQRQIEEEVYKEAEKCLICINNRILSDFYFFRNSPSSLDALVYGYLATLMKIPVPNNKLQNLINSFPNLVRYVVRITLAYFPQEFEEFETKKQKESATMGNPTTDLAFPTKTRDQILAVLFALTAMTSYALVNGIFSISFNSKEEFNQFELEDDSSNDDE